jgi:hypothetical protein
MNVRLCRHHVHTGNTLSRSFNKIAKSWTFWTTWIIHQLVASFFSFSLFGSTYSTSMLISNLKHWLHAEISFTFRHKPLCDTSRQKVVERKKFSLIIAMCSDWLRNHTTYCIFLNGLILLKLSWHWHVPMPQRYVYVTSSKYHVLRCYANYERDMQVCWLANQATTSVVGSYSQWLACWACLHGL